jgi:hypothetical protein
MYLICGCHHLMHAEGIDEQVDDRDALWLVRWECRGCGLRIGAQASPDEAPALVGRLIWTDDARQTLGRMPPWIEPLVRQQAETFARSQNRRVITWTLLAQTGNGGAVAWDPEAERRLERIPASVRALARTELERTASDRSLDRVTVELMEEVKARYFGFFRKP